MLKQRLIHIYQNRDRFDNVKTAIETYRWFCTNAKFVQIIDRLDSYHFFHVDISKYCAFVEILLTKNFIQTKLNKWKIDENMIKNLFQWWFDQKIKITECDEICIKEIILTEYNMYRHHQREIMKRTSYDWLRTMIHSLAQQIMKQNFMYYKIYVTLWFDHAWKLVFYFYYIKYAVSNDRIYFRHVNQNIDQLLAINRNQNMIQNSFSLNDEIAENCTIILFNMHRHTQKW